MLADYQSDILVENITAYLTSKKLDRCKVLFYQNQNSISTVMLITFTLYGKHYQHEVKLKCMEQPTGAELYSKVYEYLLSDVDKYLKTIDRTETWELVPKT